MSSAFLFGLQVPACCVNCLTRGRSDICGMRRMESASLNRRVQQALVYHAPLITHAFINVSVSTVPFLMNAALLLLVPVYRVFVFSMVCLLLSLGCAGCPRPTPQPVPPFTLTCPLSSLVLCNVRCTAIVLKCVCHRSLSGQSAQPHHHYMWSPVCLRCQPHLAHGTTPSSILDLSLQRAYSY